MFSRTQRQHFQSGHMGLKLENQDSTLASGSPGLASFSGFAHVSVFQNGFWTPASLTGVTTPIPALQGSQMPCFYRFVCLYCCSFSAAGLWVGVGVSMRRK